ncbi:MAG: NfeD family protein [Rhodothermales bacterium]
MHSRPRYLTRTLVLASALAIALSATDVSTAQPFALDIAKDRTGPVYHVEISGMIDNGLARYLDRAIAEAEEADASVIVLHINTFGGLVDAADHIRQAILSTPIPTVALIDKNAASAGALISYAADRIVMVPGSSIGAATVVEGGGEAAPDKYQSYMRGLMRSTAEANGRDPAIAEAMVDQSLEVKGVSEAGKVLTLSATEALKLGVSDRTLSGFDELMQVMGLENRAVIRHQTNGLERFLRFFASPVIQSILMLMMLGGLYFELQTPGIGFAGMVSLVGAALFFAPNYMAGLVESWEIVLFFIGVILLLIEVFVTPGFGFAGIAGVILTVGALLVALVGNVGLEFPPIGQITSAIYTMVITLILLILLLISVGRYLPASSMVGRLVLAPQLSSVGGYTSAESHDWLIGRTGVALTALRPSGTATIDDERVDVVSQGDFIDRGSAVRVVRVSGSRVEVRGVTELSEPTSEA